MRKGISTAGAVGAVVSIIIIGAVAGIGYFQFNVAPSLFTSTTTSTATTSGLPPPGKYVNVTIPSGAASPPGPGYGPATVKVVIGVNNTVVWTNADAALHTVTASDNSFNSGNMNQGNVFLYQFNTPGTFSYRCIYHSWMQGTVVVRSG
jgi:plastocyanin